MTDGETLEINMTDRLLVWPERRDLWTYFRMPDRYTVNTIFARHPHGFRSIPVDAQLNGQQWRTALFRYQDGSWALPVKAAIRRRHHLDVGDTAQLRLITLAP